MVRTLPGSPQAPRGGRLPDFLLIGAPKAGTSALHAALAGTRELFLSAGQGAEVLPVRRLPPPAYKGPGDAHSNQEWIWQRQRYLDLFAEAPATTSRRGESTPFYLYHRDARRRIAADLPGREADRGAARPGRPGVLQLDAPVGRRARAVRRRRRGVRAGRSSGSTTAGRRSGTTGAWGCTAARWPTCSSTSRASRCSCCATATSSTSRDDALNRVFRFLGVAGPWSTEIPSDNSRPFVHDSAAHARSAR